jgi:NACalpha-BTF3-like transcription factor
MATHTSVLQQIPTPFIPDDPEGTYQSMLARVPKGECPSQWWAAQYCDYVAGRGNKNTDLAAKEMRWMAREWRARQGEASPEAAVWNGKAIGPAEPVMVVKKRRGEVVISHSGPGVGVGRERIRKSAQLSAKQIAERRAAEANRQERQVRQVLFVQAYGELGQVRLVADRFGVSDKTVRKALQKQGVDINPCPPRGDDKRG